MGLYINPPDKSKEEFLLQHGTKISSPEGWNFSSDSLPVCLVHNPGFTAAAIAPDAREAQRFLTGMYGRRHQWYAVPKAALKPYLDGSL